MAARSSQPGCTANPVDTTNLFGKIDHQISGRDQLSIRYSLYDVSAENSRGAGGLSAPSASSRLDNLDQTIAVSNTLTLSPRTVLETRAQFADSDLQAPATDQIGPAVSIAGVASFGTSSSSPTRRVNKLYQVVNNLSHQAGAHAVRARGRLPLQRRPDHVSARPARQLHVFIPGELPRRRLQQRRLHADLWRERGHANEPKPRSCTCRMNGNSPLGSR